MIIKKNKIKEAALTGLIDVANNGLVMTEEINTREEAIESSTKQFREAYEILKIGIFASIETREDIIDKIIDFTIRIKGDTIKNEMIATYTDLPETLELMKNECKEFKAAEQSIEGIENIKQACEQVLESDMYDEYTKEYIEDIVSIGADILKECYSEILVELKKKLLEYEITYPKREAV